MGKFVNRFVLSVGLIIVICFLCSCEEPSKRPGDTLSSKCTFEVDKTGSVPALFYAVETNGKNKPATWEVIDEGYNSKKSIAITETKNSGQTYNMLIGRKIPEKDLAVSVMVKSMTGKEDQGGGPVWRAKDANNYYIARWNPLEDNFRVYYVKDGKRRMLASVKVEAEASKWHKIRIEHTGNTIAAEFDGRKMIEFDDSTFTEAGLVGLWTKADASTAFDDFEIETGISN